MKYKDFINEIKTKLGYEIAEPPPVPKTCTSCGQPVHEGKCGKRRKQQTGYGQPTDGRYTIEGQELGYKTGSMIVLLWKDHTYRWETSNCPPEPMLMLKWETGGSRGEGASSYVSGEPEPHWEHLDMILEHFCPNITYLRYKALERAIVNESYTENEYYGNSTTYSVRLLPLTTLWHHLNANKLFENKKVEPEEA